MDVISVQWLSNKVASKHQKYQRTGATEFVRYPCGHFTLENTSSCELQFQNKFWQKRLNATY